MYQIQVKLFIFTISHHSHDNRVKNILLLVGFTDEETEYPRGQSSKLPELGFEPSQVKSRGECFLVRRNYWLWEGKEVGEFEERNTCD